MTTNTIQPFCFYDRSYICSLWSYAGADKAHIKEDLDRRHFPLISTTVGDPTVRWSDHNYSAISRSQQNTPVDLLYRSMVSK